MLLIEVWGDRLIVIVVAQRRGWWWAISAYPIPKELGGDPLGEGDFIDLDHIKELFSSGLDVKLLAVHEVLLPKLPI